MYLSFILTSHFVFSACGANNNQNKVVTHPVYDNHRPKKIYYKAQRAELQTIRLSTINSISIMGLCKILY